MNRLSNCHSIIDTIKINSDFLQRYPEKIGQYGSGGMLLILEQSADLTESLLPLTQITITDSNFQSYETTVISSEVNHQGIVSIFLGEIASALFLKGGTVCWEKHEC